MVLSSWFLQNKKRIPVKIYQKGHWNAQCCASPQNNNKLIALKLHFKIGHLVSLGITRQSNADQVHIRQLIREVSHFPTSIYLLKINNGNTRTISRICSKLTIKTRERLHWLSKCQLDLEPLICHSGMNDFVFTQTISWDEKYFLCLCNKKTLSGTFIGNFTMNDVTNEWSNFTKYYWIEINIWSFNE